MYGGVLVLFVAQVHSGALRVGNGSLQLRLQTLQEHHIHYASSAAEMLGQVFAANIIMINGNTVED